MRISCILQVLKVLDSLFSFYFWTHLFFYGPVSHAAKDEQATTGLMLFTKLFTWTHSFIG